MFFGAQGLGFRASVTFDPNPTATMLFGVTDSHKRVLALLLARLVADYGLTNGD